MVDPTGMWPWPSKKDLQAIWAGMKDGFIQGSTNLGMGIASTIGAITQLGDYHVASNVERLGNTEYATQLREGANNAAANLIFEAMTGYAAGKVIKGIFKGLSKNINGVDDFMKINDNRINTKIGGKIGKSRDLPYEPGPNAINLAKDDIKNTLLNPTKKSDLFKNRAGDKVFDVFSEKTGKTVRIKEDGSFDTLIPEATKRIKEIE